MLAIADGETFVTASEISAAVTRAAERVSELGSDLTAPGSTLTGVAFSLPIGDIPLRACSTSGILEPICLWKASSGR